MPCAEAPATIANVGPGFDVLGFALDAPRVRVEITRAAGHGGCVRIESVATVPTDPAKNTAGASVLALMQGHALDDNIVLRIDAGIPIGSGLGSSAASAVAAVVAANAFFALALGPEQLLPYAVTGEGATSGSPHADNVAPSLLGGITLVRSHDPLDIVALPIPPGLYAVVVHPACTVETAAARRVLPDTISLHDAVRQWAQVGALVAALHQRDFPLLGRALEDRLIEPHRSQFIPGYATVKKAALNAGAIGCAIAGSGPSMFAFATDPPTAQRCGTAMQQAFAAVKVQSALWIGPMSAQGARVIAS